MKGSALPGVGVRIAQAMSADRSCQNTVDEFAVQRIAEGKAPCSTDTSSYCQARKRLPLALLEALRRHSGRALHAQADSTWCWEGRRVLMVDGTTLTMPDTPANQARYPQHGNQEPGLGFPIARLSGLFCLGTGAVLEAVLSPYGGKGSDEQCHLRAMLPTLEPGDVLLGDALFPSFWLLAELQRCGIDGVFDQHAGRRAGIDFRRGKRIGKKDHLIEIKRPETRPPWMSRELYLSYPPQLTVRETRVREGKKPKTLVSTLLDVKRTSKSALKKLFWARWHVELNLRHIKRARLEWIS